jgi:hypothetical protein
MGGSKNRFTVRSNFRKFINTNKEYYKYKSKTKDISTFNFVKNYVSDGSGKCPEYSEIDALSDFSEVPFHLKKNNNPDDLFNNSNISESIFKNKQSFLKKKRLMVIKLNYFFKFYKKLKKNDLSFSQS